jgi:molybdopterin synthase sulfur carrier subunit
MPEVASKNLPLISCQVELVESCLVTSLRQAQTDKHFKVDTKSDLIQVCMPKVKFTSALKRFFPSLDEMDVEATTVHDLLVVLEQKHPGLSAYLVEESGQLRKHVNVFVKDELIRDREKLTDPVKKNDVVLIFQALSGG